MDMCWIGNSTALIMSFSSVCCETKFDKLHLQKNTVKRWRYFCRISEHTYCNCVFISISRPILKCLKAIANEMGAWWSANHFRIMPDILLSSKCSTTFTRKVCLCIRKGFKRFSTNKWLKSVICYRTMPEKSTSPHSLCLPWRPVSFYLHMYSKYNHLDQWRIYPIGWGQPRNFPHQKPLTTFVHMRARRMSSPPLTQTQFGHLIDEQCAAAVAVVSIWKVFKWIWVDMIITLKWN